MHLPKPAGPGDDPPWLCLWPERLLFIGRLRQVAAHRHATPVLLVALDGRLRVHTAASGWQEGQTALIAAGLLHALDLAGGLTAVFYNDPHRPLHPRLAVAAVAGVQLDPPGLEALAEPLRQRYEQRAQPASPAAARLDAALLAVLGQHERAPRRDPRIEQVLAVLEREVSENLSLQALAHPVGLSASRLQHLFLAELGVPVRRLRLWLRFRRALEQVGRGASFTEAALEAGFASSSHFSHAFRSMFGVAARSVLAPERPLTVEWRLGPVG